MSSVSSGLSTSTSTRDFLFPETTESLRRTFDRLSDKTLPTIEQSLNKIDPVIIDVGNTVNKIDSTFVRIEHMTMPQINRVLDTLDIVLKMTQVLVIVVVLYIISLIVNRYLKTKKQ